MKEKFSSLLSGKKWNVVFNGADYDPTSLNNILSNSINCWRVKSNFEDDCYVIGIGFNSIDYFILIMLASVLGVRLILCDPKMLNTLLTEYKLPYRCVISTKSIDTYGLPLLKIDLGSVGKVSSYNLQPVTKQAQLIFFTSGTTSMPKLVAYDEDSLFQNSKTVGNYLGMKPSDKCLCLFPVNYMYGFSMVMSTILTGGMVILERPTITSQEIWEYLSDKNITILPVIGSVFEGLYSYITKSNVPMKYFENLTILNASDKIYADDANKILDICPVFWNNFGQTEAGPRIFTLKITSREDVYKYSHKGVMAMGKVVDENILLSIVDEAGTPCDDNEIGELYYSSPYAMRGYINVDGKLMTQRYISSGDLVYQNKEGVVFWVARKNEAIKLNGKFVNVSLLHKKFDQSGLVKKSYFILDQKKQNINAVFIPHSNHIDHISLKDKIRSCYRMLFPNYPRVNNMMFVNEVPRTLSGKVKLRDLANLFLKD